jgi:hypothetical protein
LAGEKGLQGTVNARTELAKNPEAIMSQIQSQTTKADAQIAKAMYDAETKAGKSGAVMSERSVLMTDVLNLWK